jgi:hypothetical protein
MTAKTLVVATLVSVSAFGACYMEDALLDAIGAMEGHPAKELRYPYIVSFNSTKDAKLAKDAGLEGWLDNRTVDCGGQEACVSLVEALIKSDIKNLDLGAYQINYVYHKYPLEEYFSEAAETRVCEILLALYETGGWSWETIARYHSSVPKRNEFYKTRLAKKFWKFAESDYEN